MDHGRLREVKSPAGVCRSQAYRTLAVPVVAIWGARDTVTPLAQGEALVRLVPNGRLEVLPNVGHMPQIDNADGFEALLVRTVGTLSRWPRRSARASCPAATRVDFARERE